MMTWCVEVEWMDGLTRPYVVGGVLSAGEAMKEHEGLLVMLRQDVEGAPKKHVASIPMVNVREYKVIPASPLR
jgi:hypothetical protein